MGLAEGMRFELTVGVDPLQRFSNPGYPPTRSARKLNLLMFLLAKTVNTDRTAVPGGHKRGHTRLRNETEPGHIRPSKKRLPGEPGRLQP
jgi:hypothetical protein